MSETSNVFGRKQQFIAANKELLTSNDVWWVANPASKANGSTVLGNVVADLVGSGGVEVLYLGPNRGPDNQFDTDTIAKVQKLSAGEELPKPSAAVKSKKVTKGETE